MFLRSCVPWEFVKQPSVNITYSFHNKYLPSYDGFMYFELISRIHRFAFFYSKLIEFRRYSDVKQEVWVWQKNWRVGKDVSCQEEQQT